MIIAVFNHPISSSQAQDSPPKIHPKPTSGPELSRSGYNYYQGNLARYDALMQSRLISLLNNKNIPGEFLTPKALAISVSSSCSQHISTFFEFEVPA